MRNWENKVIAGCMVLMFAVMCVTAFMTNSIKNKVCNCPGVVLKAGGVQVIDELIQENRNEIDSVHADSTMSVDDAKKYLQGRYSR